MIKIRKIGDNAYEVDVLDSVETTHHVTLDDEYYKRLTSGIISKEKLIEEAFGFLLEHEHNTEILTSFNLKVIEDYFPDFQDKIKEQF